MARTPRPCLRPFDALLPALRQVMCAIAPAVATAIAGCRRVIHLVASAPEGWADYERLYIDGTRLVAEACLNSDVEQLQFASSIAALYLGQRGVTVSNDTPPDDQPEARCDYAKAKILCERLLLDLPPHTRVACRDLPAGNRGWRGGDPLSISESVIGRRRPAVSPGALRTTHFRSCWRPMWQPPWQAPWSKAAWRAGIQPGG